ncbi:MAG: hypothetical protein Q9224_002056 [Gallowayella concinna]
MEISREDANDAGADQKAIPSIPAVILHVQVLLTSAIVVPLAQHFWPITNRYFIPKPTIHQQTSPPPSASSPPPPSLPFFVVAPPALHVPRLQPCPSSNSEIQFGEFTTQPSTLAPCLGTNASSTADELLQSLPDLVPSRAPGTGSGRHHRTGAAA